MSKIGILGGTFDPFHKGHETIGLSALEEANLDRLVLLPANVSPFKINKKMALEEHRIGMLKSFVDSNPRFQLSTLEINTEEVSYTYNTMEKIRQLRPDDEVHFIMGTDSFMSLESWHKGKELISSTPFIVAIRKGVDIDSINDRAAYYKKEYGAKIQLLKNRLIEISSTEIKERLHQGRSIEELVPKEIERYIEAYGLYKD